MQKGIYIYRFFNLGAMNGRVFNTTPGRFSPGKEGRYPLYRRFSGPRGRRNRYGKTLSLRSRYTDYASLVGLHYSSHFIRHASLPNPWTGKLRLTRYKEYHAHYSVENCLFVSHSVLGGWFWNLKKNHPTFWLFLTPFSTTLLANKENSWTINK